jgi:hypothetical protein
VVALVLTRLTVIVALVFAVTELVLVVVLVSTGLMVVDVLVFAMTRLVVVVVLVMTKLTVVVVLRRTRGVVVVIVVVTEGSLSSTQLLSTHHVKPWRCHCWLCFPVQGHKPKLAEEKRSRH